MSDSNCSASANGKRDTEDKQMEDKEVIFERVTALFGSEVSKLFEGKKYSEASTNEGAATFHQ